MKKMSKGMLMTALICGAVYLGVSPVYASELQEFSLDEYVVTAARTETKLVDTPVNISVVDAQTIEERHYQDVSEVLKDVPGASVLDNGNGVNEKKISINGDERVLILVDGRRLNFDMGTMTRSGYDMNMLPDIDLIERIEVLKGAGGALYGSDAVGGVVNIITKKADRSFGKVSVGYGSHDLRDMSALYSMKENKTGVTLSASKYKQGYFKYRDAATDSTVKWPGNSKYENEKISLLVEQELTKDNRLSFGYDYSSIEGLNNWSATSTYQQMLIDKKTENMYLKYDWVIDDVNDGYLQIYHNELDYFYETQKNEKTKGIDLQQAIKTSKNNNMVVGASWRESKVMNYGKYNEESNIDNISFFINDTWEFVPTWILNTGIRYDDHSEAGDETTLSIGLNKKFNENSHVYINWGQVFRAPTLDDLYYNDTDMNQLGNPNLKPETGETWTIGYNTLVNDRTNIGVSYFESDIDDAIDWLGDYTNGYHATNVSNQEKRGMELTLNHKFNDNLDLTASYTYINVKNDYNNHGFLKDYHYAPNTYRLGIKYKDGKWDTNIWLRAVTGASTTFNNRYYYYGTYPTQSYVDERYLAVDMSVTYHATKDLSFYAKGYNLFNEAYAELAGTTNGSYDYPAQSRRFIVGAEYKF